ncbi:hypothetical protein SCLCIDRAFT_108258 [Scleroderma citrinum Foug A]|uniref:Uncharacterized protein n=1 Tax=Scleroderma citrinum Foug A TaxID=1036808 RepID=A0A0C3EGC0_9AGAM|nr:hypothetical protein SCLCIDRAFT_108258 [Scleroderma citrinum Foug A]
MLPLITTANIATSSTQNTAGPLSKHFSGLSISTTPAESSAFIYSHVCNLSGIISSNTSPVSTVPICKLAQPLGDLTGYYLTYHWYTAEALDLILEAYGNADTDEKFVRVLASQGMAINEVKFLLLLIGRN